MEIVCISKFIRIIGMCLHPCFSLPVNRTVTVNSLISAFHNLATNTIEKKNKSILKCYFGSNKTFRLALICGTVKLMQMSDFNKPDMELAESHGVDALCTPDCIMLQIQGVALVKLAYPLLLNIW